ncbi:hypothetical protein [Pelagivirga sediminicola]|uniref:hypothetical protein n=1 Tax=Pelagivirga sediminicola TaxID=2170575 RepID=UPI0010572ADB|nr:hypothetical protein [Pelagivirga sediminicola]
MRLVHFLCALSIGAGIPFATAAEECADGNRADNFPFWEYIANNAVRTADSYATERNPAATFVFADAEPVYQHGGEYVGEYLVRLVAVLGSNTNFAMLRPNFDFCGDPEHLDEVREDLFTVVIAKHNGREF